MLNKLAAILLHSVNGWEYFHWALAQELTKHNALTETTTIINAVKAKIPKLSQYVRKDRPLCLCGGQCGKQEERYENGEEWQSGGYCLCGLPEYLH